MKTTPPTKVLGDAAEARALAYLVRRGLVPVERNYRVARDPRARGGEVDLIARDTDGTLVFVEVRARRDEAAPARLRGALWPAPLRRAAGRVGSMSSVSKASASSGFAPPSMRREQNSAGAPDRFGTTERGVN